MKKTLLVLTALTAVIGLFYFSTNNTVLKESFESNMHEEDEMPKRTRIDLALKHDFEITKDPALGYPPTERLRGAFETLKRKEAEIKTRSLNGILDSRWKERGPYNVGGRTRAVMVDKGDPTGKTVYTGGVAGGVWRTRDITAAQPVWENLGDFLKNLSISSIVQEPDNPSTMYFSTGEGYVNGDAVRGLGIWKSTDNGDTWEILPSTENSIFYYTQRMIIHPNGDIYAATRSNGVQRSQNGGQSWQTVFNIRPDIADLELGPDNSVYFSSGYASGGGRIYRSPDGPDVGDAGTWEWITGAGANFPLNLDRIELAVSMSDPQIIYALGANGGDAVGIYKTTNGGQSWVSFAPPSAVGMDNFTRGQAWYDLTIAVDPNNPDRVIIGGIDLLMSTNGGVSWTQISQWFGGGGFQYVHADQHHIIYDGRNSDVIYFTNDGGIWRTENGSAAPANMVIRDRNTGYNVTQFYACAMHPDTLSNYFLAGAQDNGSQQFDDIGIAVTREVLGGDGAYCHIDQNEPEYQIVSLQFGSYVLSNDGGESFGAGGVQIGAGFINISDYDNDANILYAFNNNGGYYRWAISEPNGEEVDISNYGGNIRHIAISPNVPNRIYIGNSSGGYVIVDDAHTGSSVSGQIVNSSTGGSVSTILIEKGNEDHVILTKSNYGVQSVVETLDGGLTWTNVEGDLPDMPVRSAVFNPDNPDQILIGTEAGIWATDNLDGANTVWMPQLNGMPATRCDMLQIRESDKFVAIGTHGRGLFTTDVFADPRARIFIPKIGYTNADIQFNDYSVNPDNWLWNFGDGSTSTQENPTHDYSAIGVYPVSITVNSSLTASDDIKILPDRATPYTEEEAGYDGSFENVANEDFGVYHVEGTAFERGNSTMPGKSGTHTGNNAWVVGLNEPFYVNNTETMLYTPNYDLTEEGIYEFSFWAKYDIQQGFDGFRVEYSTDKGKNWQVLGERGDDWYNYDNTNSGSATVFPFGSQYFTGKTTGTPFKRFKTNITDLQGNEAAFRFVFKTNGSTIFSGLAIDDVEVKALKGSDVLQTKIIEVSGEFPSTSELLVTWKTQPEYRSDFFEVEYSENGRDWQKFDEFETFPAAGFSIDEIGYENEYDNQRKPLYYLRVKATDQDEGSFYSDIIVLRRNVDAIGVYKIYPNPFSDHINIAFNDIIDGDVGVQIYDALGRNMYDQNINVPDVYARIDMAGLPRGTYFLRLKIGEETFVEKIQRAK